MWVSAGNKNKSPYYVVGQHQRFSNLSGKLAEVFLLHKHEDTTARSYGPLGQLQLQDYTEYVESMTHKGSTFKTCQWLNNRMRTGKSRL